ncbi:MAG: shikimate dehydrogenase [Ruminococcaceae bacterium]|jgi:shikimate dehydrogenase|nr:shikimate dehydrogenase [Oscillospiraceae bacterium]
MQQYELIGYPLGHSLSPEIHRALFALDGIEADYRLDSFPPGELDAHLPDLKRLAGFNVTIPYKQAVIPALEELAGGALLYGSVNTISCRDGILIGYNTDCTGFLRTMSAHHFSLKTSVCVLGAGGVGRMFAIESARQGAQVTVAVRKSGREKADGLAREIREKLGCEITVCDIDRPGGPYGLVINATPVGMSPNTEVSPVTAAIFSGTDAVFDCIYNPAETRLLKEARLAGCRVAGGMDMLVWQAAAAHEIWNGSHYEDAQMAGIIAQMNEILAAKEDAQ